MNWTFFRTTIPVSGYPPIPAVGCERGGVMFVTAVQTADVHAPSSRL